MVNKNTTRLEALLKVIVTPVVRLLIPPSGLHEIHNCTGPRGGLHTKLHAADRRSVAVEFPKGMQTFGLSPPR